MVPVLQKSQNLGPVLILTYTYLFNINSSVAWSPAYRKCWFGLDIKENSEVNSY